MAQSKLIDPDWIVLNWVTMGIEDFFLSFRMSEIVGHSRYDPFINAMGLELVCKGYLLALKRSEYEGLGEKKAKEKVNKLAKSMNHKITALVKEIKKNIGQDKFQAILDEKYDGFTGSQISKVIEAAYLECRYPVPNYFYENFPVSGLKNAYEDPVNLSGFHKFCYEFCRVILTDLKEQFGYCVSKSWFDGKITGDQGKRFGVLLFKDRKQDFISDD